MTEEEKFLKELEKMIEEDEMKLENEESFFNDKFEVNKTTNQVATTRSFLKVLNGTTATPTPQTNATLNIPALNSTTTAAARQNFTSTTEFLNLTTVARVENGTKLVNTTANSLNFTTPKADNKTQTTRKTLIFNEHEAKEALPKLEDESENFPGEHHALVGDSAGFIEVNLFLLFSTLITISFFRNFAN